jgi:tetratricopeptide (TPR) repeat protein
MSSNPFIPRDEHWCLKEAASAFAEARFAAALRFYGKTLEYNAGNVEAWTGQVRMLIELGEFSEAGLWADKALERFPNEPELLAGKAVASARSGDLGAALAFSDAAMAEKGETAYLWLARGDVLLARQEKRADYCFEKALLLSPNDWLTGWLAGRIRYYYKQFALALQLMQAALEKNATHFNLWLECGRCQEALGLSSAARHSFEQARQLNPGCDHAAIALSHLRTGGMKRRMLGFWRRLFKS